MITHVVLIPMHFLQQIEMCPVQHLVINKAHANITPIREITWSFRVPPPVIGCGNDLLEFNLQMKLVPGIELTST